MNDGTLVLLLLPLIAIQLGLVLLLLRSEFRKRLSFESAPGAQPIPEILPVG